MPHHHKEVEVFHDGEHLATAILVDELAATDVTRLLRLRASEARWLAQTQRAAAAKRRTRFAALTEPGPVTEPTALTGAGTTVERAHHDDLALARAASDSLAARSPISTPMLVPGIDGAQVSR